MRDGHRGMYLKIGHIEDAILDAAAEAQHLRWLQGRLPVPEVVHHSMHDELDFLLITEIEGVPSHHPKLRAHKRRVVELLAETLTAVSEIDIEDCPFGFTLDHELEAIEERIRNDLYDEEVFEDDGRAPDEVFQRLVRDRDFVQNDVFTHGDLCMANIILDRDATAVEGIIDWGTAGIGDVHRDLMALSWSVEANLGERWVPRFYEAWNGEIDAFRVEYFGDLDMFF